MRPRLAILTALLALVTPGSAHAQEWRATAAQLGTPPRVLVIGTRPEDEDNALIAWLSLGRHVETAYLSLTRGEAGVNRLGTELQSALAVVRTAELLAERARDRAHQYFTRAYDFGPVDADTAVESAWPHDSLLVDVVSVVRAFRPHAIVVLDRIAGERDATRRLTARLAAEAFAVAGDTVRVPTRATSRLGAWTVARLLTAIPDSARDARSVGVDVGELDRGAGESYAEIGAAIRLLQRTQPPLPAPPLGPVVRWLRIDSSRVGDAATPFGALDTSATRFRTGLSAEAAAELDSLDAELASARRQARLSSGDSLAGLLARVAARTSAVRLALPCADVDGVPACAGAAGDLAVALDDLRERATRAMLDAASITVDGTVARELVAAGESVPVTIALYDGGSAPLVVRRLAASSRSLSSIVLRDTTVVVHPDSVARWSTSVRVLAPSYHWWQINGLQTGTMLHDFRRDAAHPVVAQLIQGEDRIASSQVEATLAVGGVDVPVIERPLVHRDSATLRDDDRHPLAGVPPVSVLLERNEEYQRAGEPIDRLFRVYLWSARSTADTLAVTLRLPPGLHADSLTRLVALPPLGTRNVYFLLGGRLKPGSDTIQAVARSMAGNAGLTPAAMMSFSAPGEYKLGIVTHDYPHIPTQQFVRFARERIESVDLRVPPGLRVAYVKGRDDLVKPLAQLRVPAQLLDPSLISVVDLSAFSAVLIGSGALASDDLLAAVPTLREFARRGGTIVILPGGDEVVRAGLLPFPLSLDDGARRVRDPESPVVAGAPRAAPLRWPNVLDARDFERWSGDRARGLPHELDPRYAVLLSVAAGDTAHVAPAVLSTRLGKGTVVYSALTLGDQLSAATPGAARLLTNLLSIGLAPANR